MSLYINTFYRMCQKKIYDMAIVLLDDCDVHNMFNSVVPMHYAPISFCVINAICRCPELRVKFLNSIEYPQDMYALWIYMKHNYDVIYNTCNVDCCGVQIYIENNFQHLLREVYSSPYTPRISDD